MRLENQPDSVGPCEQVNNVGFLLRPAQSDRGPVSMGASLPGFENPSLMAVGGDDGLMRLCLCEGRLIDTQKPLVKAKDSLV